MQIRLFIYKRSGSRADFKRDFLEVIPHDLSIMGLTLAFAAQFTLSRLDYEIQQPMIRLVFLYSAFIPFLIAAIIPIISNRRLRLLLGVIAYLLGAALFAYTQFICSR